MRSVKALTRQLKRCKASTQDKRSTILFWGKLTLQGRLGFGTVFFNWLQPSGIGQSCMSPPPTLPVSKGGSVAERVIQTSLYTYTHLLLLICVSPLFFFTGLQVPQLLPERANHVQVTLKGEAHIAEPICLHLLLLTCVSLLGSI